MSAAQRLLFLAIVLFAAALVAGAAPRSAQAQVTPVAWCGTDLAASDRVPDGVNGFQWHVVYAFPSDGVDRFAELASGIATDLAAVDAWWRAQDPARAPRFDLHAFPGCRTAFGRLDLSRVQLPYLGARYRAAATSLARLLADLNRAGFASPDKKVLVYYDGPVDATGRCGEGNRGLVEGGPNAFSVVYLGACGAVVGTGERSAAVTAAHELVHGLNALAFPPSQPGPPNACSAEDAAHPCDDPTDILYPRRRAGTLLATLALDAGGDDYYGHKGAWWDARDSLFLYRLQSKDRTPPRGPRALSATSDRGVAILTWPKARDEARVTYRVYRDGRLRATTTEPTLNDGPFRNGTLVEFGVRASDRVGFLSPLVSVRFKVGFGIVDAEGALVADTVPPSGVPGLRGVITPGALVLRWGRARDTASGVAAYRILRDGERWADTPRRRASIPKPGISGLWTVVAIDGVGNVGRPLLQVRIP